MLLTPPPTLNTPLTDINKQSRSLVLQISGVHKRSHATNQFQDLEKYLTKKIALSYDFPGKISQLAYVTVLDKDMGAYRSKAARNIDD